MQRIDTTLEKMTQKDIPVFSFSGLKTIGKIVKVIDGDTVHIVFDDNGRFVRQVCRLAGIDTPEYKKNLDGAKKARNRLIQLCTDLNIHVEDMCDTKQINGMIDENHKLIKVVFFGKEKYGRELVEIYDVDGVCVNTIMVNEGFAKQYNGGKKDA